MENKLQGKTTNFRDSSG